MTMIRRVTLMLLLGPAMAAGAPFSFDAAPGRLPKDVVPIAYTVGIVPDAESLVFAGTESVTLLVRRPTATIVFNSLNQTLRDVRWDGKPVRSVASEDARQLTTVMLRAAAPPGRHRLTFSYQGKIETQPRGLFRQFYARLGGERAMLLSTKMESTDARRMFPCWDEPAFRATIELTVTIPKQWAAVANMPIARRAVNGDSATTTFQRSPRMPTYLVEFSAGDLASISERSGSTTLSVWADRGRERDGAVALANAKQILADYNDYFGFAFPLPKLDSIAIPGGFGGAMENWGAITYNDQLLLLTAHSTVQSVQDVFSVMAHEMAHQWNGDLVTMGWWDDLWLNESFASWRAAKETDLRHPDWKWWELEDRSRERALRADAFNSSHAIQQHVTDELQADNAFDPEITYNKGQAVLRMFEAYLGEDVFRDGIRRYIKSRAYSNATSADLWNALAAASGKGIADIAPAWIDRPGFPVIDVSAVCDGAGNRTVKLTQRRFLLSGEEGGAGPGWRVPVRIRSGAQGSPRSVLLTRDGQIESAGRCDEPLSLNPDAIGYYRVRFDAPTFAENVKSFSRLRSADKIALLDDQWALVESGKEGLASYLALASAVGADLDTRVWQQIAGALAVIEYDERGTSGHDDFAAFARSIIRPVADRLGWEGRSTETPDLRELRRTMIRSLGAWGDPATIEEASRRFAAFVQDRASIPPDDQPVILSIVARNADDKVFDQLHAIARQTSDETEQQRYFSALMDVADPGLARRSAAIALSEEIPPQGARWRLGLVIHLAPLHHELAWNTFSANSEALLAPHTKYAPLFVAQSVPGYFWDSLPLDRLEAWVRAHVPAQMGANVAHGMETARFNREIKDRLVPAAGAYVRALRTP